MDDCLDEGEVEKIETGLLQKLRHEAIRFKRVRATWDAETNVLPISWGHP